MLRHRDVRSLQRVGVEELRVVAEALAGREAGRGRRVLLVGAGEDAEQLGRVGHRPRHRAGGVLIGGDRHDAVPADEAERRLDAGEAVLTRRAEDRSGSLRADADDGEVRAHRDARSRAGASGRQHRTAVVERRRRPGVDARIVRVETKANLRQVAAVLEELEAQLRAEAGRHAEGDEVGELGQGSLAEDDGSGAAQLASNERVRFGPRTAERDRSRRGWHVQGGDVVLEDDGNAEQRLSAAIVAQTACVNYGMLIDVHEAVERLSTDAVVQRLCLAPIEFRDPREVDLHEILGSHVPRAKCTLDVRDGCLDHVEIIVVLSLRGGRQNERGDRKEYRGTKEGLRVSSHRIPLVGCGFSWRPFASRPRPRQQDPGRDHPV